MTLNKRISDNHRRRLSIVFTLGLVLAALGWLPEQAVAQTVSGSTDMVISQVYTRGGEPGAALRNDFVEFFNRGTNNVNLADYSLVISTTGPGATPDVTVSFVSSSGILVVPGEYLVPTWQQRQQRFLLDNLARIQRLDH
jgi:hypothetical protein